MEYFNLGVNPIFRDTYTLGGGTITKRVITLPKNALAVENVVQNVPNGVSRKENRTGYCKTIACIAATVMKTVR